MEEDNAQVRPDTAVPEKSKSGYVFFFIDLVETLALAIALFIGFNAISARIRVLGTSMEPNLHTDELVFVNKLAYQFGQPRLGDVIVFHFPRDPDQEYIKRVIGVPGDQVRIASGKVYINGALIQEPYIAAPPIYSGSWTVPEKSLFVLGDNRNNSSDSHSWGPVPLNYVTGKAVFVYWPPTKIGTISHSASAAPAGN